MKERGRHGCLRRGRRLVLGDVHGAALALKQVMERAGFDPALDELVAVGDLVDGWPDSSKVLERLEALPRFRWALGNHDRWARNWIEGAPAERAWLIQGGAATVESLLAGADAVIGPGALLYAPDEVRARWLPFLRTGERYVEVDGGCLVVHAGLVPGLPMAEQDDEALMLQRELAHGLVRDAACTDAPLTQYRRVFMGHTSVDGEDGGPVRCREFWMVDQGAGWGGRLTLMDMDTEEWWQSDPTALLYGADSPD